MATNTRPELADSNKWWISKHRYYELRHFCLQYTDWMAMLRELDGLPSSSALTKERVNNGKTGDPTFSAANAREWLVRRIDIVNKAAYEASGHQFWYTILVGAVTTGDSYDKLGAATGIMPVSRSEWYIVYRKFFWFLDKLRD